MLLRSKVRAPLTPGGRRRRHSKFESRVATTQFCQAQAQSRFHLRYLNDKSETGVGVASRALVANHSWLSLSAHGLKASRFLWGRGQTHGGSGDDCLLVWWGSWACAALVGCCAFVISDYMMSSLDENKIVAAFEQGVSTTNAVQPSSGSVTDIPRPQLHDALLATLRPPELCPTFAVVQGPPGVGKVSHHDALQLRRSPH